MVGCKYTGSHGGYLDHHDYEIADFKLLVIRKKTGSKATSLDLGRADCRLKGSS